MRLLSRLGYVVETAADGAAAVERYAAAKESGRPFDLVIMDLTIPGGMGGKEALRELKRIDPGVKALVSSGYSNDRVMSDYERHGFLGVVAKPYDLAELSQVIASVIGARAG